jgi:hypothetical protein
MGPCPTTTQVWRPSKVTLTEEGTTEQTTFVVSPTQLPKVWARARMLSSAACSVHMMMLCTELLISHRALCLATGGTVPWS